MIEYLTSPVVEEIQKGNKHVIAMDNYFTTPAVMSYLTSKKVGAFGTARSRPPLIGNNPQSLGPHPSTAAGLQLDQMGEDNPLLQPNVVCVNPTLELLTPEKCPLTPLFNTSDKEFEKCSTKYKNVSTMQQLVDICLPAWMVLYWAKSTNAYCHKQMRENPEHKLWANRKISASTGQLL